jgi:hypothetical protein
VVRFGAISQTSTNGLLQANLLCDAGGFYSISARDNAGSYEITHQIDEGAQCKAIASGLALNTWTLIEWSHGGSMLTAQVGAGATPAPIVAGSITSRANDLRLGCNFNASQFANVYLADLMHFYAALTAAEVNALRRRFGARYGVPYTAPRSLGRWIRGGDSVDIGYSALGGGWWAGFLTWCAQSGISVTPVGSLTDGGGNHFSTAGQKASGATGWAAECIAQGATLATVGWGVNDVIAGDGDAATLAAIGNRIDDAFAAPTMAHVVVRDLAGPLTGAYAGFEATRLAVNAGLPALCASKGALHAPMEDVTTSDGLHPNQLTTGYPVMTRGIAAGVLPIFA